MNTLDELFEKDPDTLTRADMRELVAKYREERTKFKAVEASGKNKRKPKQQQVSLDLSSLTFPEN